MYSLKKQISFIDVFTHCHHLQAAGAEHHTHTHTHASPDSAAVPGKEALAFEQMGTTLLNFGF